MLKAIERVLIWIVVILAVLVGPRMYREYMFVKNHHRAIYLMQERVDRPR
jgi:hypothetical protein